MRYLTAPKGLGDAIYLRAVVLHFLRHGEQVTVYTRWPDVFHGIDVIVRGLEGRNDREDMVLVGYSEKKKRPELSSFARRCLNVGIGEPVELRLDWTAQNQALLDKIKHDAAGRPIFIYQPLKIAMNPSMQLVQPRPEAFARFIAKKSGYYRIKLGHPPSVANDSSLKCELDLFGKGFIFDTFDVCTIGDLFFSEPCFITCIGEALDKRTICMFSKRAIESDGWESGWTPTRMFHKKHLSTAVYDE